MNPHKQGYLYKRAAQGLKKWNKRYFEVSGTHLLYYNDEQKKDKKGDIDLKQARAIVPSPSSKEKKPFVTYINGEYLDTHFCFEIHSPQEIFYLNAPNSKEMDSWITVLNEIKSGLSPPAMETESTNHNNNNNNNAANFGTHQRLYPTHTISSNLNQLIPPHTSPSKPLPRPQVAISAKIRIVPYTPPAPMEFPNLAASTVSFDCSWEKQLITAILNEKETRSRVISEREERLKQGSRPPSVLTTTSLTPPFPVGEPNGLYPRIITNGPVVPSVKDEVFLELVNENFDPELIKRGFVLFPISDRSKLTMTVRVYAGLAAGGTPEGLIVEAYNILNGDMVLVPKFIQSYHRLMEFGFPDSKIKEALLQCKCEYEASVQYLVEHS